MNIFGIGLPEMAVIAAIALLVFGPKRLPELGRTLGRTLKGFQSASREFEQEFRQAIDTETVRVTTADQEIPSVPELPRPELPEGAPPSEGSRIQAVDPETVAPTDPQPSAPLPSSPSA
jgi:sec-independent protein translocase protein TatA